MQTLLQLDICLQSYEGFDNSKNNMKQRNWNTVFANISITTSPTSDSFPLIMSHIYMIEYFTLLTCVAYSFYYLTQVRALGGLLKFLEKRLDLDTPDGRPPILNIKIFSL